MNAVNTVRGSMLLLAVALASAMVAIAVAALSAVLAAREQAVVAQPNDLARFAASCGLAHATWRIAEAATSVDPGTGRLLPTNLHQAWRSDPGPISVADPAITLQRYPRGQLLSADDLAGVNTPIERPLRGYLQASSQQLSNITMSGLADGGYVTDLGFARHFEPGATSGTSSQAPWTMDGTSAAPGFDRSWSLALDPAAQRYRLRYAFAVEDLSGKILVGFQRRSGLRRPDGSALPQEVNEVEPLSAYQARMLANLLTNHTKQLALGTPEAVNLIRLLESYLSGRGGGRNAQIYANSGAFSEGTGSFHRFKSTGLVTGSTIVRDQFPVVEAPATQQIHAALLHYAGMSTGLTSYRERGNRNALVGPWLHDFTAPAQTWAYAGATPHFTLHEEAFAFGAIPPIATGNAAHGDFTLHFARIATPYGVWPGDPATGGRSMCPWQFNLLTTPARTIVSVVAGLLDWRDLTPRIRQNTLSFDPRNPPTLSTASVTARIDNPATWDPVTWRAWTGFYDTRYPNPWGIMFTGDQDRYPRTTWLSDAGDFAGLAFDIDTTCLATVSGTTLTWDKLSDPLYGSGGSFALPNGESGHVIRDTGFRIRSYYSNVGDTRVNADSIWLDVYAAAIQAIAYARWSWDPAANAIANAAMPAVIPSGAVRTLREVDAHFCKFFGATITTSGPMGSSLGTTSVPFLRDNSASPEKKIASMGSYTGDTLTIRLGAMPAITGLSPGPNPSNIAKGVERILNDVRLSLFGSAVVAVPNPGGPPGWAWEYPEFEPIDFDGDTFVQCSAYATSATDNPVVSVPVVSVPVVPVPPAKRFSFTGRFTMAQQSPYYAITVRGEVIDTLRRSTVASTQQVSVFVCDPNRDRRLDDSHVIFTAPIQEQLQVKEPEIR